jgi:hypothetical protein
MDYQRENQHHIINMSHNMSSRTHKLYYNRPITTDWTVHNNSPDTVMLDKIIKEAYLMYVAVCNSHNL